VLFLLLQLVELNESETKKEKRNPQKLRGGASAYRSPSLLRYRPHRARRLKLNNELCQKRTSRDSARQVRDRRAKAASTSVRRVGCCIDNDIVVEHRTNLNLEVERNVSSLDRRQHSRQVLLIA